MSILEPDELVAEYILQVSITFRPKTNNRLGNIQLWKKGGWFGKGDELLKFCPTNGCKGYFSDTFTLPGTALHEIPEEDISEIRKWPIKYQHLYEYWYQTTVMCSTCKALCVRENLPDSYCFNLPAGRLADRMCEFFGVLHGAADVYLVRTKNEGGFKKTKIVNNEDILAGARGSMGKRYQVALEAARDRDCVYYPLKSIIKDASTGDLAQTFKSLLEA